MPGKDDEKLTDLDADFFGEDLDWLDEDSQEVTKSPPPVASPSAPPPPPPFEGGKAQSVVPRGEKEAKWAQQRQTTPSGERVGFSAQKTLVFSDIPTLPPLDDEPAPDPATESIAPDDEPTASIDDVMRRAALDALDADGPDFDYEKPDEAWAPPMPDLSISTDFDLADIAGRLPPDEAPTEADDEDTAQGPAVPDHSGGDTLAPTEFDTNSEHPDEEDSAAVFEDASEEVPLVRTQDPAPFRVAVPEDRAAVATYTPVFEPLASLPAIEGSGASGWDEIALALETEAGVAGPEERGVYLFRAGWVCLHRLGDEPSALRLFDEAHDAGCIVPQMHRERADLAIKAERWGDAAVCLERMAQGSTGVAAAEGWHRAALLRMSQMDDRPGALEALQLAHQADPENVAVLGLLGSLLPPGDPARVDALLKTAGLYTGMVAAERTYEAAAQLPAESDRIDTLLGEALVKDGRHAPSFVWLEQRLLQAEDHATLAELYAGEVRHADGPDAGWWQALGGRHALRAGQLDRGRGLLAKAAASGWTHATIEETASLSARGDWSDVAETLHTQATAAPPERAAWLWFRLGWLRERTLKQPKGAVDAYQACLKADPSASPAEDGILRALARLPDKATLLERLESSIAQGSTDAALPLAEAAEDAEDWERAKTAYGVVAADPSHPAAAVARAGIGRVLAAQEDWPALSELLEQRASTVEAPALQAHLLHAAASAGQGVGPGNVDRSIALFERALDAVPDHLAALEALAPLLRARGSWTRLASAYERAGMSTEDHELTRLLLYRAATLHARRANDPVSASRCLQALLLADPTFPPALAVQEELAALGGDLAALRARYLLEADSSDGSGQSGPGDMVWSRFAAAVIGGIATPEGIADLRAILNLHHGHRGASDALQVGCEVANDLTGLEHFLRERISGPPSESSARESLRLAELLARAGRPEDTGSVLGDLATMTVRRPLQPAVRLARRVEADEAAVALLQGIAQPWARIERAALLGRRRRTLPAAETELRALIDEGVGEVPAYLASAIGAASELPQLLALGQQTLAESAGHPSIRFANTLYMAERLERSGHDGAGAAYARALALEGGSVDAALGVLRQGGDPATLTAHVALDGIVLAALLEQAGNTTAARAVLQKEAAAQPPLPGVLHLERLLEKMEAWEDAHDTLMQRLALSRDEGQRVVIEARRRQMLADRLSDSDDAWSVYQDLHKAHPDDPRITEALARIAGARGETELAIGYLDTLAGQCDDPKESARYKRRVAEAQIAGGKRAEARAAFHDALGFVPGDAEALAGLKQLCEEDEDWNALIEVLDREASGLAEDDRGPIFQQIAGIAESKLEDPKRAMGAWQRVLDLQPSDENALARLLALAESSADWTRFLETGNVLAALSRGADRTALLRRIGIVCQEHLNREDAVRYFERAVQEDPPDLEAAQRLEEIYRRRGDAQAVARTLDIQGRVGNTDEQKVAALIRAAQHELSSRHDRDAAAGFYQRALKIDAGHEDALRFMASHLFESGRFDEALPICERLAPMVENDQDLDDFDTRMELAQFYYYYAEMLRLAGRDGGSIDQYERALALNPTYVASLEAIGPLYKEAGSWAKALKVFRQLLQLSGGQGERHKVASTYTNLGLVERALGNAEKAKKRFNKALEIDPNHVEALKGMALLLEDREDWSNLLNIYNNIIYHATVADDVIDAYMTKGRVLDDHMSRPDKAAQHYQRSLDFKPDQPTALLRMAELAMRRDAYQEAGELALKGSKMAEEEPSLVRGLLKLCEAAAAKDAGRDDDAVNLVAAGKHELPGTPDGLLADLEAMRQHIKDQLPR